MTEVYHRLANLLTIKSLVTLSLTIVFCAKAMDGQISQDFMTIYAIVIAFYFGTQGRKAMSQSDPNEIKN